MGFKVEYIKTNDSIWSLQSAFDRKSLYYNVDDSFTLIDSERVLFEHYNDGEIYIQVKKELLWHDCLDEFSYPLALCDDSNDSICSWEKIEILTEIDRVIRDELRPATKDEVQVLLDNAPE